MQKNMTRDVEFEELINYLEDFYHELEGYFDDDQVNNLLDINSHIVTFGNIHAFMENKEMNTRFLFTLIKSILKSLIIIKNAYKDKPNYNKYIKRISKRWRI